MPVSQPNYLSVDPVTGAVSAEFTGGLTLTEGENAIAPPNIRWRANSDPTKFVGDIGAYEIDNGIFGINHYQFIRAYNPTATPSGAGDVQEGAMIGTYVEFGSDYNYIYIQCRDDPYPAGAPTEILLDSEGRSSYLYGQGEGAVAPPTGTSPPVYNHIYWNGGAAPPQIWIPIKGEYSFEIDGSCFNNVAGGQTGFMWYIDGSFIGSSVLYFNVLNSHQALCYVDRRNLILNAGLHTISASGIGGGLAYDANDLFQLVARRVSNFS